MDAVFAANKAKHAFVASPRLFHNLAPLVWRVCIKNVQSITPHAFSHISLLARDYTDLI